MILDKLNKIYIDNDVQKHVWMMIGNDCGRDCVEYLARRTSEYFAEILAGYDEREQNRKEADAIRQASRLKGLQP